MPHHGSVPRTCETCGAGFLAPPDQVRKGWARYCSRSCKSKGIVGPAKGRFWAKVEKTETCWLWKGAHCQFGYGFIVDRGKRWVTHRYSYQLHFGPIPDGLQVLHRCDNGACVRPDHLWLGTQSENLLDCNAKGRGNLGKPHPRPDRLARGDRHGSRTHPEAFTGRPKRKR